MNFGRGKRGSQMREDVSGWGIWLVGGARHLCFFCGRDGWKDGWIDWMDGWVDG